MDPEKIRNVSVIVVILSAFICLTSIFFSYRFYVSSKKLVTEYRDDLAALRQSYAELEKQYQSAGNNIGRSFFNKPSLESRRENEATSDHRKKVQQLEQIISSTGLDQLAASEDLDPTILLKIYEDYALQDSVNNYREKTLARNRELHPLDRDQYIV